MAISRYVGVRSPASGHAIARAATAGTRPTTLVDDTRKESTGHCRNPYGAPSTRLTGSGTTSVPRPTRLLRKASPHLRAPMLGAQLLG